MNPEEIKIAVLSNSDIAGGGSVAAFRLVQGFIETGNDVKMVVRNRDTDAAFVKRVEAADRSEQIHLSLSSMLQKSLINENRSNLTPTIFSIPYPGLDLVNNEYVKKADVINIHWVNGMVSYDTLKQLADTGKPLVWTLHDMNAFTGGCHYAGNCRKYIDVCSDCPQLEDNSNSITKIIQKSKKNLLNRIDNLVIVTPSRWLASCASESALLKGRRVEVIPYGLDTEIFTPGENSASAKQEFGIEDGCTTILFGASDINDKRKGIDLFINALRDCKKNREFREIVENKKVKLMIFGQSSEEIRALNIPYIEFDFIKSTSKLAKLYSAADIFVLPSLEDNLPNTMLEAMSCGTPVVGFRTGGLPDMVIDDVTGKLAEPGDFSRLGEIIRDLVFDSVKRQELSKNCRKMMADRFKLRDSAGNYLKLFQELLENNNCKKEKSARLDSSKNPVIDASGNRFSKVWTEFIEKEWNKVLTSKDRGKLYSVAGDFFEGEKALKCYAEASALLEELSAPDSSVKYNLASLYKKTDRISEAEQIFKELLKSNIPVNLAAGVCFHLGDIAGKTKDRTKEIEFYSKAVKFNRNHSEARKRLLDISCNRWLLEGRLEGNIVIWGWGDNGEYLYKRLSGQFSNLRVVDNKGDLYSGDIDVCIPEKINFEEVDTVICSIMGDVSWLENSFRESFVKTAFLKVECPGIDSPRVIDNVLTEENKAGFLKDYHSNSTPHWIVKKNYYIGDDRPDISRCRTAVELEDFSSFSYGQEYNQKICEIFRSYIEPGNKTADIGCVSGLYPVMQRTCKADVTIVDIRKIELDEDGISSEQMDLSDIVPEEMRERFDLVSSISTVEHAGLGRYGDRIDPAGDFRLVKGIADIIKPGGIFICSVPVGPGCVVYNLNRIYSEFRLNILFKDFELIEKVYAGKKYEPEVGDDSFQPIYVLRKKYE